MKAEMEKANFKVAGAVRSNTATTTSRSRTSICRTWSRTPTAKLSLKTVRPSSRTTRIASTINAR